METVWQFCCSFATRVTQNIGQYAFFEINRESTRRYTVQVCDGRMVMEAILVVPTESSSDLAGPQRDLNISRFLYLIKLDAPATS